MAGLLVILAHPQWQHSRANRAMADAARRIECVVVHDLYELYPDFYIDVPTEQELLASVQTVVLQFPLQWYSVPALMKEWLDVVLEWGWAYGPGGEALKGKRLQCSLSAGGGPQAYLPGGTNRYTIDEFLRPLEQTARLCGMDYLEPLVLHNAIKATENEIEAHAGRYAALLNQLLAKPVQSHG